MKHGQFLLFDGRRREHGVICVAAPLDDTIKVPSWMSDRSQRFSVQWRALDPSFDPKIEAAGLCARLFECRTKPVEEISKVINCPLIKIKKKITKRDIIQSIMSRIQIHEQSRDVVKKLVIQVLCHDNPKQKRNRRLRDCGQTHLLFWVHPGVIQLPKMTDLRTSLTTGNYKGIQIHSSNL